MLLFVSAVITKKKSHSQATYLVVVSCVGELVHLEIKRHRCEKGEKNTMFLLQEKKKRHPSANGEKLRWKTRSWYKAESQVRRNRT